MTVALQSKAHKPLASIVDRAGRLFLSPPALFSLHCHEDAIRLVPRGTLALRNNRANRNIESQHPPEGSRLRTKLPDALAHRCERLGIDPVDVTKPRAHIECASQGAAKEQERIGRLQP